MRKHFVLISILLLSIGDIICLRLGFPVCFTPGNEVSFFFNPLEMINKALSYIGLPSDWMPSSPHVIRKNKLNGVDGLTNAFFYYEFLFTFLIVIFLSIIPAFYNIFYNMFYEGLWSSISVILLTVLSCILMPLAVITFMGDVGFELLDQTSSLDYKIVFFVATLPALVFVIVGGLMIWALFQGGGVSSGSGESTASTNGAAALPIPDSFGDKSQAATMSAAARYKTIAYDTTDIIDRQVARVDSDGRVYDTTGIIDKQVRRIDKEGRIYDTTDFIERQIGRVDDKGRIFDTTEIIDKQIGRIDEYGRIFDTTELIDKQIGRVDKTDY